ncbi:hypothetical protein [Streptomyces sp. NPDC056405]|uniref:hypothetical protein n=1 Tax=Streptomyces sp. NPDC056405 TaxID=3345811 RepID=UPI0035DECE8F
MGLGSVMMPTIAASYTQLSKDVVARAAPTLSAMQHIGGSLGSALLVTALTQRFTTQLTDAGVQTGSASGTDQLGSIPPEAMPTVAPLLASSFGYAFWITFALTALIAIPALFLPRHRHGKDSPEDIRDTEQAPAVPRGVTPDRQAHPFHFSGALAAIWWRFRTVRP